MCHSEGDQLASVPLLEYPVPVFLFTCNFRVFMVYGVQLHAVRFPRAYLSSLTWRANLIADLYQSISANVLTKNKNFVDGFLSWQKFEVQLLPYQSHNNRKLGLKILEWLQPYLREKLETKWAARLKSWTLRKWFLMEISQNLIYRLPVGRQPSTNVYIMTAKSYTGVMH